MKNTFKIAAAVLTLAIGGASFTGDASAMMMKKPMMSCTMMHGKKMCMMHKHHSLKHQVMHNMMRNKMKPAN